MGPFPIPSELRATTKSQYPVYLIGRRNNRKEEQDKRKEEEKETEEEGGRRGAKEAHQGTEDREATLIQ